MISTTASSSTNTPSVFNLPTLSPSFAASVSGSFVSAASADNCYTAINNAKLKSVEQLHSYEQFTQMVAGAHLKPVNLTHQPLSEIVKSHHHLHRRELFDETNPVSDSNRLDPFTSPFTSSGTSSSSSSSSSTVSSPAVISLLTSSSSSSPSSSLSFSRPISSHEFVRDWKRIALLAEADRDLQRLRYLKLVTPGSLRQLMKAGAGLECLGDVIGVLSTAVKETDLNVVPVLSAAEMFALLAGFSSVDRFSMNISFLTNKEKEQTRTLFARLEELASAVVTEHSSTSNSLSELSATVTPTPSSSTSRPSSESSVEVLTERVERLSVSETGLHSSSELTGHSDSVRSYKVQRSPSEAYPMMLPGWGRPAISNSSRQAKYAADVPTKICKPSAVASYVAPPFTLANVQKIRALYTA